jgi:flavin-dependent dehydrogenase
MKCDVAIIGGGPAGSTVGSLLKKYCPWVHVVILEQEKFPRDHVGESHLPAISEILNEMGVWEKVEAANFPIKIGGTYRWGHSDDLWDLEFVPGASFVEEERPGAYSGQRLLTAFQVDRSIYDKILLDHAASLGCEVYEEVKVKSVPKEGDRVLGLQVEPTSGSLPPKLADGMVEARYYIDASGERGVIRSAMEVGVNYPTTLRNIAIWDYFQDADWAVSIGKGGTRIQVMSLGWGWMWFIPITETRTSVGLVLPADYYKASGKSREELFLLAIEEEPLIRELLRNAHRENVLQATKDWNFVADRIVGENWFLAGDSCGFADPILSAGMTLAHTGARRVAYTLLEFIRGEFDPAWLRQEYQDLQLEQIAQHMRFAEFWYKNNGIFTDLKAYCSEIAKDRGLTLNADDAFRWLATGGFTRDVPGLASMGSYRLASVKVFAEHFTNSKVSWGSIQNNCFKLNLDFAERSVISYMVDGRIEPVHCWRLEGKHFPVYGVYKVVKDGLTKTSDGVTLMEYCVSQMLDGKAFSSKSECEVVAIEVLEALINDGFVKASLNPDRPMIKVLNLGQEPASFPLNTDNVVVPN